MNASDDQQQPGKFTSASTSAAPKPPLSSPPPPAILARVEFPTLPDQGPARALDLIQQGIHELLDHFHIEPARLAAIGLCCGGPLDRLAGIIQAPAHLDRRPHYLHPRARL